MKAKMLHFEITRAGTILIGEDGMYLIVQQRGGPISFPKGHIENGESQLCCAYRETFEETGINVRKYHLKDRKLVIDSMFYIYQLPKKDVNLNYTCNEIEQLKWMTAEQILKLPKEAKNKYVRGYIKN